MSSFKNWCAWTSTGGTKPWSRAKSENDNGKRMRSGRRTLPRRPGSLSAPLARSTEEEPPSLPWRADSFRGLYDLPDCIRIIVQVAGVVEHLFLGQLLHAPPNH